MQPTGNGGYSFYIIGADRLGGLADQLGNSLQNDFLFFKAADATWKNMMEKLEQYVKNFKLIIMLSIFNFFLVVKINANEQIKKIEIYAQNSLAETVYSRLEMNNNLPRFVKKYIDKLAINRPEVPSSVWNDIKNTISYSSVKNKAIEAMNNNYSSSELQALINDYEDYIIIPITKLSFRNELMLIVDDFSKGSLINQIHQKLTSNGYDTIQN